jgi:hypothetical protein
MTGSCEHPQTPYERTGTDPVAATGPDVCSEHALAEQQAEQIGGRDVSVM